MRAHRIDSPRALVLCVLAAALAAGSAPAQDDDEDIPDLPPSRAAASDDESDDDGDDEESDDDGDDEESDDDASDDAAADEGSDAKPSEAAASEEKPAGDPPPAVDLDDVETIYVVQGKPRLAAGTIEISPQFVQSVNDRFTSQTGIAGSLLYNIKENFALELSGGAFFWWDDPELFFSTFAPRDGPRFGGSDTDTTTELNDRERLQPELVKLYRQTWFTTIDAQWSPIYGKFSLHDAILGTFSIYLSVGAGLTGLQNRFDPDMPGPFDIINDSLGIERAGPVQLTTSIGGGFRFYLLDWLGLRIEVRDYVQPLALLREQAPAVADTSTFEVRNTILVHAGVSFILPTPWRD